VLFREKKNETKTKKQEEETKKEKNGKISLSRRSRMRP